MKKNIKGGIETIIAAVVLVGIVIALIIGAIIPMSQGAKDTAGAAVNRMGDLQETIAS